MGGVIDPDHVVYRRGGPITSAASDHRPELSTYRNGASGTRPKIPTPVSRPASVTDADRDATVAQLREHYAAGRLSLDEFQDRLDAVYGRRPPGS